MEARAELEQRGDATARLDPAGGRRDDPGDQAEQRRLARAVAADQADRLARLDRERDVPERPDLGRRGRGRGRARAPSASGPAAGRRESAGSRGRPGSRPVSCGRGYREHPPHDPRRGRGRTPDRRSASAIRARRMPRSSRLLLRLGVEVPADLEMVGDEADRADQHVLDASARGGRRGGRGCPAGARARRSATRTGTRSDQSLERRGLRDQPARSRAAAPRTDRLRRGSAPAGCARVKTTCALVPAHAIGPELDQARLVVPALDERELGAAGERRPPAAAGSRRSRAASSAGRARARRSGSAPAASAASAASAIRGRQCFIPVKTGRPSSASSAARVCSVISFSGFESSIPSRR